MRTSFARTLTTAGIGGNIALNPAFREKAALGPTPYDESHSTAKTASTQKDTDQLNFDTPAPADNAIAGLISQINQLIRERRSAQAITVALDALGKFDTLSDSAYDSIIGKIAEAEPYLHLEGSAQEAEEIRRRIIRDLNLSSHYDDKLFQNQDTAGFVRIIQGMRATNTSTFEGGTAAIRPFAPTLHLAA